MTKACTRVIYDKADGRIIDLLYRVDGGLERSPIEEIAYVDIPYDDYDPVTHEIEGVDASGVPIIVSRPNFETPEQKRIRELEDALLLALENDVGGIL